MAKTASNSRLGPCSKFTHLLEHWHTVRQLEVVPLSMQSRHNSVCTASRPDHRWLSAAAMPPWQSLGVRPFPRLAPYRRRQVFSLASTTFLPFPLAYQGIIFSFEFLATNLHFVLTQNSTGEFGQLCVVGYWLDSSVSLLFAPTTSARQGSYYFASSVNYFFPREQETD